MTPFLEPVEHRRRRSLTDARNSDRQPAELAALTSSTLDIQRGVVRLPVPPVM